MTSTNDSTPRRRRRVIGFTVSSLLAVGTLAVGISSAQALSSTCTPVMQTDSNPFSYDYHRVRATCSAIGSTTKVRGVHSRDGAGDEYTTWFTTTNTYYYSPWARAAFGSSVKMEQASR